MERTITIKATQKRKLGEVKVPKGVIISVNSNGLYIQFANKENTVPYFDNDKLKQDIVDIFENYIGREEYSLVLENNITTRYKKGGKHYDICQFFSMEKYEFEVDNKADAELALKQIFNEEA